MDKHLLAVEKALAAGQHQKAVVMIKCILKENPSADAFVMAANLTHKPASKIKFLRRALELDEWHNEANRLLHQLEDPQPLEAYRGEWANQAGTKDFHELKREKRQLAYQERKGRQRTFTRLGCFFSIILSMSCSLFAFRAIGWLPSQMTGILNTVLGGMPPVYEIEGTPIEDRYDAPLILTPSMIKDASPQGMEVMDAGYLHEHQFSGLAGAEYAIYVQFLSEQANQVSRNVVLLNPFNQDATGICQKGNILEGDNNITLICSLSSTGTWKLRVLGREGESVGAYFVGVQRLDL